MVLDSDRHSSTLRRGARRTGSAYARRCVDETVANRRFEALLPMVRSRYGITITACQITSIVTDLPPRIPSRVQHTPIGKLRRALSIRIYIFEICSRIEWRRAPALIVIDGILIGGRMDFFYPQFASFGFILGDSGFGDSGGSPSSLC